MKKLFGRKQSQTVFDEYSVRFYGQPKLPKPKELRGIKQIASVDYIYKKCRNQIFIKDNDVWIKHRDYFSQPMPLEDEDMGMPLSVLVKKYLSKDTVNERGYPDAWGSIILRNEAWVILQNLILDIKNDVFELDILNSILRQKEQFYGFEKYSLCCTDMDRFYEKVINEVKKYLLNK